MPYSSPEKRRVNDAKYRSQPKVAARRKAAYAKWSVENIGHIKSREARRRLEKRAMCLIATTRTRAVKRGLEFDLGLHVNEIQVRVDKGVCELTGQPFNLSPGRKFNSPSLDRIDPSRGYTYDNVRIVLNLVNVALGDWGEGVLAEVMGQWLDKRNREVRGL